MIRLIRPEPSPAVLRADSFSRREAERKISDIVQAAGVPTSKDFNSLWTNGTVRQQLAEMHNVRCCYCERIRDATRESDIEHFRPKTEVSDARPSKPGYWWLAYSWNNLFFACKTCNETHKKCQFPISGTRARGPGDDLSKEEALLLDPSVDHPEQAIGFDYIAEVGMVWIYGVGPEKVRADKTVEVCGLNRRSLLQERGAARRELVVIARKMVAALEDRNASREYIQRLGEEISRMTSSTSRVPFIGMRRAFFRNFELGEYVSND